MIGSILYLMLMGIFDTWLGMVILIVAMVKKSNKIFWVGTVIQVLFCLGNLRGAITGPGARIDSATALIFFIIFATVSYIVVNWEKSKK